MSLDNVLNRTTDLYNFNPETSIPDLTGKVVIVTGGNVGLGYYSILQIAPHNPHKIYLTARSQAKFDAAVTELRKEVATIDKVVHFLQMDLASLSSVKTAVEQLLADTDRIDILMNNAGVMGSAPSLTPDGYEIHFGTNHMGHALFTKLLMPTLLKTAEHSEVRVVNVSSGAYQMADAPGFDEKLVKTDMATYKNGGTLPRYGPSKLANVLHAKGLAKHYPSVTSVAIAPGRVKTALLDGLYADGRDKFYGYFQKFYDVVIGAKTPFDGARTQVWAATEPLKDRVPNGAMFFPVGKVDPGTTMSNDEGLADKLWEFTEAELKRLGY